MHYIVIDAYFDVHIIDDSELHGGWIHVSKAFESKEQAEACRADYLCPEEMFRWE